MTSDEEKYFFSVLKQYCSLDRCSSPRRIFPRDIIALERFPVPQYKALYFLKKWTKKGLYDYGVSLDMGWITERGMST